MLASSWTCARSHSALRYRADAAVRKRNEKFTLALRFIYVLRELERASNWPDQRGAGSTVTRRCSDRLGIDVAGIGLGAWKWRGQLLGKFHQRHNNRRSAIRAWNQFQEFACCVL